MLCVSLSVRLSLPALERAILAPPFLKSACVTALAVPLPMLAYDECILVEVGA